MMDERYVYLKKFERDIRNHSLKRPPQLSNTKWMCVCMCNIIQTEQLYICFYI